MTTVELIERDGRELRVTGLDGIDNTPVLDIKPHAPGLDCPTRGETDDRRENPRGQINRFVRDRDIESLVVGAGELHGHFCLYLSLGMMAGVLAQRGLGATSAGMEEVVAIVETNNCFIDGFQYATDCTFGNNDLVYRDFGKTVVTLVKRGGRGVRIRVKDREKVLERYPKVTELFEKVIAQRDATTEERSRFNERWPEVAFDLIRRPLQKFCDIETDVEIDIPESAPNHEDVWCADCGEQVMASQAIQRDDGTYCIQCGDGEYSQLDGRGLRRVQ